jgi:hypothetical protein
MMPDDVIALVMAHGRWYPALLVRYLGPQSEESTPAR